MNQSSDAAVLGLRVTIGDQRTTIDATQTARLGRSPQCEVAIANPTVSQVHAYLVPEPTGWYIEDRGSTNGTFVDGIQVRRKLITKATNVTLSAPQGGVVVQIEPIRSRHSEDLRPPTPDAEPAADRPKPLAIRLTLGRAADCEIALPDRLISHHHAELQVRPDGLHLTDLRSRNGTYVNGRRVTETMLVDGDLVTLGNTDLVVANGVLNLARGSLHPPPEQGTTTEPGTRISTVWTPIPSQAAPEEPAHTAPPSDDPLPATTLLGIADIRPGSLVLDEVGYTLPNGTRLLDGVSFRSEPGSLTAIIGPSGAGKSTLVKVISGDLAPDVGRVNLAGLDLHTSLEALSSRLGIVPQDDILHKHLTVVEVLRYAARLRLSADTKEKERTRIIASVMADLGLTEHAETRVASISGGQRKRLSIAIELLTEPSALVLDEPTSGLDPALDRQVMYLLRQLADRGRIVVVVTHSLAYLSVCDDVLLLAPGGRPAYHGPVDGISDIFGTEDWADIFSAVTDAAAPQERTPKPRRRQPGAGGGGHRPGIIRHHLATVMHRQVRLLLADTRYLAFLLAVPVFSGLLALVVPGNQGFGPADPAAPTEAGQLLTVMILAATFMGSALTVRDLVGERDIFLRERRAGLAPTAYLLGKTIVFGAFTVLQSAVLVTLVCLVRGAPTVSTWAPWPAFELFLGIALTAFASAQLALCGSAWVRSTEQVMPLLVVLVMTQLVVAGGLVPVTGRAGLSEFSMLLPSRWGYAITSSTIDLRTVVPIAKADALWRHTSGQWLFDAGMLVLITTVAILVTARLLAARPVDRRRRSAALAGARNTRSKGQRLVPSTANSSTAAISSTVNGAA